MISDMLFETRSKIADYRRELPHVYVTCVRELDVLVEIITVCQRALDNPEPGPLLTPFQLRRFAAMLENES